MADRAACGCGGGVTTKRDLPFALLIALSAASYTHPASCRFSMALIKPSHRACSSASAADAPNMPIGGRSNHGHGVKLPDGAAGPDVLPPSPALLLPLVLPSACVGVLGCTEAVSKAGCIAALTMTFAFAVYRFGRPSANPRVTFGGGGMPCTKRAVRTVQ